MEKASNLRLKKKFVPFVLDLTEAPHMLLGMYVSLEIRVCSEYLDY